MTYNRDLQKGKEPVFDATDTLELVLLAFIGMIATLPFNTERMAYFAPRGYALAMDIAEWLVREGAPLHVAHKFLGACLQLVESRDVELWDLTERTSQGSPNQCARCSRR